MAYKPAIRMVPEPLWNLNLRKGRLIPKSRWSKIRTAVFDEHGLACQTCGKVETERKRLNVHEEWEYDLEKSPAVARLAGLRISCWHCHMIEHFGSLINMVRSGELTKRALDETVEHFCRVNQVGQDEFKKHFMEAKAEWQRLSQLEWLVDWGLYADLVAETTRKRDQRRRERVEEWAEDDEDQALYEWPYLHTGEPM